MARFDKLEFTPAAEVPAPPEEVKRDERDDAHWMRQADAERRAGHYENALRYYSRALEENRSAVEGWLGQVQMLILLDECPEAETWSRKALELFPANGDLMAARAQALCRTGDLKQAHALCDGAMAHSGQSAYVWLVRGELMVAGRQEIDRHCFDKARQFDGDWLLALEVALVYLHYGLPGKALVRVRQAVESGPGFPLPWYVQGVCQQQLGLSRQARESFERCLELAPRHLEAERRIIELDQAGWSLGRRLRRLFSRS